MVLASTSRPFLTLLSNWVRKFHSGIPGLRLLGHDASGLDAHHRRGKAGNPGEGQGLMLVCRFLPCRISHSA